MLFYSKLDDRCRGCKKDFMQTATRTEPTPVPDPAVHTLPCAPTALKEHQHPARTERLVDVREADCRPQVVPIPCPIPHSRLTLT